MEIDAVGKTIAQSYIEEGIAIGEMRALKKILLLLGSRKLGSPDTTTTAVIDALQEPERIERITDAIDAAASWDELLRTV